VGDVEVKEKLAVALNAFLDPIRERRAKFEAQSGLAERVIYEGTQRASQVGEGDPPGHEKGEWAEWSVESHLAVAPENRSSAISQPQ